jgi:uncharacterized protein (DUF736 family)
MNERPAIHRGTVTVRRIVELERELAAALKAKEEAEQKTSIWEAECEVMRHAHALATKRAEEAARDAERYRVVRNGDVVGFAVMAISEAYERHLSIDGDRLDALADEARKP